jgi:hypothetical protein
MAYDARLRCWGRSYNFSTSTRSARVIITVSVIITKLEELILTSIGLTGFIAGATS